MIVPKRELLGFKHNLSLFCKLSKYPRFIVTRKAVNTTSHGSQTGISKKEYNFNALIFFASVISAEIVIKIEVVSFLNLYKSYIYLCHFKYPIIVLLYSKTTMILNISSCLHVIPIKHVYIYIYIKGMISSVLIKNRKSLCNFIINKEYRISGIFAITRAYY
uniref:Ribosomal protein S11 n=1 Tax=Heterorhabditis bacteriophora TaxID=37862 RepID=A0A1I7W6I6_HETBA